MSWDIVIFSSKQKITSVEEVDPEMFIPIDFDTILKSHFSNIKSNEDYRDVEGEDYSFTYYADTELGSHYIVNLYGEKALFELIQIAKKYNWQIFDTGIGEMLDLEHPEKNGYESFQAYLQHILNSSK